MIKRIAALALALTLVGAIPVAAYASDPKIDGFQGNQTLMDGYLSTGSGKVKVDRSKRTAAYQKALAPGYRDYIRLSSGLFDWEEYTGTNNLTGDILRDNSVSAHAVFTSGEEAVESVSIDHRQQQVVIQYARTLASTEPVPFEFNVHLVIGGRRYRDHGITFSGTLENPVIAVSKGPTVDLTDAAVMEAKVDISKIRIKMREASITTRFEKGKQYYAACEVDALPPGNKLVKANPGLSRAVTMHTVGLDSGASTVKLHKSYAAYYVYDKSMNYLGKGDEQLPYRDRYYLATKKL